MSVAKVSEISATSTVSFEDAIKQGIAQGEQDAPQRPQRVDQGTARAGDRRRHHGVPGQHDGDLRHRRLTRDGGGREGAAAGAQHIRQSTQSEQQQLRRLHRPRNTLSTRYPRLTSAAILGETGEASDPAADQVHHERLSPAWPRHGAPAARRPLSWSELEAAILRLTPKFPVSLVIPMIPSDLDRPALCRILDELCKVPYLDSLVISLNKATLADYARTVRYFERYPGRQAVVWNEAPPSNGSSTDSRRQGCLVGTPGRDGHAGWRWATSSRRTGPTTWRSSTPTS